MMDKDKCPYCGADTRPGDNFCLNCGNRLPSATPSNVSQPPGDATVPAAEDWGQSRDAAPDHNIGSWDNDAGATIADPGSEQSYVAPTVPPQNKGGIEQPARFILRADNGDVLQEYPLDKPEITIGRAPNSDILLSKDKLTSRRHATVRYENGAYLLRDERSANGSTARRMIHSERLHPAMTMARVRSPMNQKSPISRMHQRSPHRPSRSVPRRMALRRLCRRHPLNPRCLCNLYRLYLYPRLCRTHLRPRAWRPFHVRRLRCPLTLQYRRMFL